MLYALKNAIFWSVICIVIACKPLLAKPDLQKVYKEGLNWANGQKAKDNSSALTLDKPNIGVCQKAEDAEDKEPEIASGCYKKKSTKTETKAKGSIDDVLDEVTKTASVQDQHQSENHEKILVFISFSMPQASLEYLLKEAHKYNAIPIMRGLKDDSFKVTQTAYMELGKDLNQGIEINPDLFETYQITHVPVFVRVRGDKEIARIRGNVSIDYAYHQLQKVKL